MKQSKIFVKSSSNMLAWYFYFCDFILIFVIHTAIYVYARVFFWRNGTLAFFLFMGINIRNEFWENGQRKNVGKHEGLWPPNDSQRKSHTLCVSVCVCVLFIKYA